MKKDTEVESDEEDSKVTPEEQKEWKTKILAINNRKLLDYICTLCDSRRSIGRADHEVSAKKKKGGEPYPFGYGGDHPVKMKPLFPTEEDPEKIV